jgi:LEA14-like dessication related protein
MVDERKSQNKAFASVFTFVILLGVILVWDIPRVSLADTINLSHMTGPSYIGEIEDFDQFLIVFKFKNTGNAPVTITGLTSKVLLNSTDYDSRQVTNNLATIQPREEIEVPIVVQLRDSPIGLNDRQVWNITVLTEISAESNFSFIKHVKTVNHVDSLDWEFFQATP